MQHQARRDGDERARGPIQLPLCANWERIPIVLTDRAGVCVAIYAVFGNPVLTFASHTLLLPWFLATLSLFAQPPSALSVNADASPPSHASSFLVFRG